MLPDREYAALRLETFLDEVLRPLATPDAHSLNVSAHQSTERIALNTARNAEFDPVDIGWRWGPAWSTCWFRLQGEVPASFAGQQVALRFSSGTEGLLWKDGVPNHGFDLNRDLAPLHANADGGEAVDCLVEAACNMPLGISTFWWDHPELHARWKEDRPGRLESAEVVVFDETAWKFCEAWDLGRKLLATLPTDSPRSARLEQGMRVLHGRIPAHDPRPALDALLPELQALVNGEGSHGQTACVAVGHAHIDTAWLWPLAETRRKCLRTFATVLRLMERFPSFRFLCSQTQQYAWILEDAPELFQQIKARVADGRWEAGGAMWIEPDCNVPSGESLIRQVLHGCGWWTEQFGADAEQRHVYLPDTFGFPASLPQIIRGCGLDTFVTNKISWCERNRFPHVSFDWIGIDGTRVLTHLTPGHNYNSSVLPADLLFAEKNLVELDTCRLPSWLQPFGFGDGGGGPTAEQIERIDNMASVEGLPTVRFARADEFCEVLHRQRDLHVGTDRPFHAWDGELYLELHRGTFTTQRWLKQANHDAERALRSIELLHCGRIGADNAERAELRARLDATWKTVLLNQFHDILPGTSIPEVYQDARAQYAAVEAACKEELDQALEAVARKVETDGCDQPVLVFNPASTPRGGLVDVGGELLLVDEVPACGVRVADAAHLKPVGGVEVDGLSIRNEHLFASFDEVGRVIDLRLDGAAMSVNAADAEGEPLGLNQFVLYEDRPRRWEAWDIDRDYMEKFERIDQLADRVATVESGPLRGAIEFEHAIGESSRLVVRYRLDAGARRLEVDLVVDWQEERRLLRAMFPTGIHASSARCGIQFGSIDRPTHRNTSWEEARFEVPGHRWMDISEAGRGPAVLDRGIIGRSVEGGCLGLSLLRAPNFPDPKADRGEHRFQYALMPHEGDWRRAEIDAEAEAFNEPLIVHAIRNAGDGAIGREHAPFDLAVDGAARVEVVAFKPAEDGRGAILRLVEKHGGHGRVRLSVPGCTAATAVDLRERPVVADCSWHGESGMVECGIRPFQIISVRLES